MAAQLPPLQAIRAFEAAARYLSFTKAAEELGMTQAAVSYQIKVLEDRVGSPLFIRKPRQVALTEAGRRLADASGQAFEILREAWSSVRGDAEGTLVISTVQTFATWLAKHLGPFQITHPSIAVRIVIASDIVDFARDEVDVGIRSGGGKWPNIASHHLFDADFTPMLSPKLAETIGGVSKPADLLKLPIISPDDPWWVSWFDMAGVSAEGLKGRPLNRFGAQALEGTAAIAGQGVGILTPAFFVDELDTGRLIQPFPLIGNDGHAYWLVYPESRRNSPKVRAFRDWMLAEVEKTIPQASGGR
jgi:LysR family glycine cleavage system transcriptional activator